MNNKDLIEKIKKCFSQVSYLGDEDLTVHPLGFDEEFYYEIKGKAWQELEAETLKYHHDCIGLLTPKGFQYYLPAFLIADLKEEDGTVISEMLIIGLSSYAANDGTAIKGVSGHQWLWERMDLFSEDQKDVLIDFFNYQRKSESLEETIKDLDRIVQYIENSKIKNI